MLIDCIVGYDNGSPIWMSDVYPSYEYEGYRDEKGIVHLY